MYSMRSIYGLILFVWIVFHNGCVCADGCDSIPRGLLFNSDSGVLAHYDPPMTAAAQANAIVDQTAGTAVSVFLPCVNFGDDTFVHETQVAEQYDGRYVETFEDTKWGRLCRKWVQNVKGLRSAGDDPLRVWEKRSHELGLQFWPTLRMNEIHENSDACDPMRSQWKKANRQLCIGDRPPASVYIEGGSFSWAMDYSQEAVRSRRLAVIEEILTNYDVDGFELDFLRHALFFKEGQAGEGMKLMNSFIQQVRSRMDAIGKKKGKSLVLHVKVPERVSFCEAIGLDVGTWIRQGWADCVTPMAPGYLDMNADVREFVQLAEGTKCKIFGGLERSIKYYDQRATIEMMRAAAAGYYQQGASNMYLFNFDCHSEKGGFPFTEYALSMLKELGDPEVIAAKNKHYCITRDMQSKTPEEGGNKQLPVELNEQQAERTFVFTVGDDLDSARKLGILKSIILKITLKNYRPEFHRAEIQCNGTVIHDLYHVKNEFVFSSPPIVQGRNELTVRLIPVDGQEVKPFRVEGVELLIQYR